MKYSVIIPIYKAESTLERCLDSLLKEGREDVELLLINDGSPDNSGEICDKYAVKYPSIRYFVKENGGVSTARNLGLDEAKGEYILFVDSDDYVSKGYFSAIDKALDEKHPDMLLFGYQNFGGRSSAWNNGSFYENTEYAIATRASKVIRDYLFSSLWSKAFRRDIIEKQHLRFNDKLAIGEDQTFIFSYAMHIKSLKSIKTLLYYVNVENEDSLSRKRRDYLTEQLLKSNLEMISALDKSELSDEAKKAYMKALSWMFYRGAYSCSKELLKYELNGRERRKEIRRICKLFSRRKVNPTEMKCWIIALPVKLRMGFVIDYLIKRAERKRREQK